MGGLNLMGAVRAYQQGTEWRQAQEEVERQDKLRTGREEAQRAFTSALDESKAKWAMDGAQGNWEPNDETMLDGVHRASRVLIKHGDMEGFLQNEARAQAQRIRLRQNALQKYNTTGDAMALARTTIPTLVRGEEIVGIERTGGMPALASIGREATPEGLRVKFKSGEEREFKIKDLVAMLKESNIDPAQAAKQEAELTMARLMAEIKGDVAVRVEGVKAGHQREAIHLTGVEARRTEGLKSEGTLRVEGVRQEGADRRAMIDASARENIALEQNASRERAVGIAASATTAAAGIRARGAVEAAGVKAKSDKDPVKARIDEVRLSEDVHKAVTAYLGEKSNTLLGSGGRIGTQDTATIRNMVMDVIKRGQDQGKDIGLLIDEAAREVARQKAPSNETEQ